MAQVYLVTGISGVGKTTVVGKALARMKKPIAHINFGDTMLEIAKSKKVAKCRDDLKYLDNKTAKWLQELAVRKVNKMRGKILLDTHFALETPYGYLPGITHHMASKLNIMYVIIIEAPVKELLARRKKDKSIRARVKQKAAEIEEQFEMDRIAGMVISIISGSPLKMIENVKLAKAAEELANLLE